MTAPPTLNGSEGSALSHASRERAKSYSVSQYEYRYSVCIDIGQLLRPVDAGDYETLSPHRALAEARTRDRVIEHLFGEGIHSPPWSLGSYQDPKEEGQLLERHIQDAVLDGGKRIFTETFLQRLAPFVMSVPVGGTERLGVEDYSGLNLHNITPDEPVTLQGGSQVRYAGSRLRLFRHGVLGLEFRFQFDGDLDVESTIRDLRNLETRCAKPAAHQKMGLVFQSLKQAAPQLGFKDRWLTYDQFERLATKHRILVVKALAASGAAPESVEITELTSPDGALREVCGLLNRARWYNEYWASHLEEFRRKFIAYQTNEIFITDGNSTFVYYPKYWSPSKNKQQYIENLTVAVAYLLSWEAVARYFNVFIDSVARDALAPHETRDGAIREGASDLMLVRRILFRLRDALATRLMVDHGFTTKVLRQLLEERELGRIVDDLTFKVNTAGTSISESASFAQQDRNSTAALTWQRWEVWAAAAGLLITAIFSVLSFFLPNGISDLMRGDEPSPSNPSIDAAAPPAGSEADRQPSTGPQGLTSGQQ